MYITKFLFSLAKLLIINFLTVSQIPALFKDILQVIFNKKKKSFVD